ncbi:DUF4350 domain-containing protein [Paenarthrobacter sp. NPDC092416]|uniref:DUF4350 domain-containing protein n=1 Tax=Paenarthrobacter sp. NPDC092416 TaxID=3364386 RepID=UPI003828FF3D
MTLEAGRRTTDETLDQPQQIPGPGFATWFRQHLAWIAIGTLLVGLVTFMVFERSSSAADNRPLSARNPAPDGAMAVAEILGRHGVTVTPTETLERTLAALRGVENGATVLLYDPRGFLDAAQLDQLIAAGDRVVVVSPRLRTLNALDQGIRPGGVVPESISGLEPACDVDDAKVAGRVSAEGPVFVGPTVCYPTRNGGPGMYAESDDGRVVVLGSTELLDNEHLAVEGNAALALRTLGKDADLIWYTPGLSDASNAAGGPTLNDLAPPWLVFVGPWLAVVALLAIVWRGRRLGPLVFEPLPVVVQAAETAEGRARLYQDSRALDRATDNLRAGTLARLAKHFNLGTEATAETVLDAVTRRLGTSPPEVRAILLDYRPQTEGHLVQWAQQIERMEQEATTR